MTLHLLNHISLNPAQSYSSSEESGKEDRATQIGQDSKLYSYNQSEYNCPICIGIMVVTVK